jgi:ABC-type transport system involved in multi-copper enzyme maturation permease subunit
MSGSLSAELLKLGKRPATWVIGAVFVLIGGIAHLFPYLRYRSGQGVGGGGLVNPEQVLQSVLPQHLVPAALGPWPLLGGAVILVLGALITGNEYGWGTLKTVLSQRAGRLSVLAGKLVAAALVCAALVLVCLVVDAVSSFAVAAAEHRAVSWPSVADLARDSFAGWLIVMMWCVVGMFLGIALRGTAVPIGVGLVWILVVEQLIRSWFAPAVGAVDVFQRWLPGTNAGSLVAALGVATESQGEGHPGVNAAVSGVHAWIFVAGYVVVLAVASAALLRRRDVT